MSSSSFENSCDDGNEPFGVFYASLVQNMLVTWDESNHSGFAFERMTKRNCLDCERKQHSLLRKLIQNETKRNQNKAILCRN